MLTMVKARHRIVAVSAMAALALGVAACSSSGGPKNSSSSAGARDSTSTNQTFTQLIPGKVSSLDTSNIQGFQNEDTDLKWESTLLEYKPKPDPTVPACSAVPSPSDLTPSALVKSFTISPDGKKIAFVLNSGVKSSWGDVLTSADVKWTIDRFTAIDPVAQFVFYTLAGFDKNDPITITSPSQFTLNLSAPHTYSAELLTTLWFEIYDSTQVKKVASKSDPWGKNWLTTHIANFGPWQLDSFKPNVSVTYTRNPHQPATTGNITKVIVSSVADAGSRAQLLAKGEATITGGLSFLQDKSLNGTSGVTVAPCPSQNQDFIGVNSKNQFLNNAKVRQAISMAINRAQLVSSVYQDYATASKAGISSVYNPTDGTSNYVYNVSKAKQLLSDAGYPHGGSFTLTINPGTPGDYVSSLAVFLKAQLAAINVNVTIQNVGDATDFQSQLQKQNFDAEIYADTPSVTDPGEAYLNVTGCQSNQNYGKVCYPDNDSAANATSQPGLSAADRARAYNKLSSLVNETMPTISLADTKTPYALRSCAVGVPISASYPGPANLSTATIHC